MLGEQLKRRREELGLTLAEISETTRIGTRFLKAIETEDFKVLPEGIYARSFVRTYARYVKMDEDEALRLFHEKIGEENPAEVVVAPVDDNSFVYREPSGSFWSATAVAGVLALVLCGGGYILWRQANKTAEAPAVVATTTKAPAVAAPAAVAVQQPVSTASEADEALMVSIQASDECWISFTADDGKRMQMMLKQGDLQQIQANAQIDLSIGNTQAVSIRINGRDAHLPADTGVVLKKLTITPETASALIQ